MNLEDGNLIAGIIGSIFPIIAGIFAFLKRSRIKNILISLLTIKHDPNKAMSDDLSYIDVKNGCEILKEKLSEINKNCYIVGIDRGGAIIGGIMAKMLLNIKEDDNWYRLRHLHMDGLKDIHCNFNVAELDGSIVILIDDATRNGGTLIKARKTLEDKFEEYEKQTGKKINVKMIIPAVLLLKITAKDTQKRVKDAFDDEDLRFAYFSKKETDIWFPWDIQHQN